MKIAKQKGTRDIFFDDMNIWQYVEKKIREIANNYHLNEIRTPVFEATELFARGVGEETDVVNKEMYTFLDKGGRSITLRPELTAGIVRSYIENGFDSYISPVKFWYMANMYRYEKMQKGRFREFTQFGVEIFGSNSYLADLESIAISYNLYQNLGLADKITLSINSIGCSKCRGEYIEKLKKYIRPHLDNMCETCKIRFDKNPLRILDCKEEKCNLILQNAPMITDNLCKECSDDFENLKSGLTKMSIPFVIDKKIVRGLDYYNKTVYEYIANDFKIATGGGGRYDTLVEMLGGKHTPAVGFGIGLDRIIMLLKEYHLINDINQKTDIYFVLLNEEAHLNYLGLISKLRNKGVNVELDICNKSFKAQLKYADKINCNYVCIIGEDEVKNNIAILKNMATGEQVNVDLNVQSIINSIK
ncbi:MAG: histidine--tRNA ligase [Clostridia bacterium]|nr:histidine--tRNA ligase [Clostridia bacterium]